MYGPTCRSEITAIFKGLVMGSRMSNVLVTRMRGSMKEPYVTRRKPMVLRVPMAPTASCLAICRGCFLIQMSELRAIQNPVLIRSRIVRSQGKIVVLRRNILEGDWRHCRVCGSITPRFLLEEDVAISKTNSMKICIYSVI